MDGSRLRVLDDRKPTWRRPEDEVVDEVLIPALQVADRFDCMVGYFGGGALQELAHGLASFILRSDQPLRLLVSPILSDADQEAIRLGTESREDILEASIAAAFSDEAALSSALAHHTKQCFAYLLANHRLQMKVVLVENAKFHLKEWIFRSSDDVVVLSGSANFTGIALLGNVERLNLHRSWRGGDNQAACAEVVSEFDEYWSNGKPHAVAVELPLAVREGLIASYDTNAAPTECDYQKALELEGRLPKEQQPTLIDIGLPSHRFAPPQGLVWEVGDYSHQGQAVLEWEKAGRHGILAMATGAGKTITSLLCAWRLWRERRKLVIVVAAPTRPLVTQWDEECREFGLDPYVAGRHQRARRLREIDERLQRVELGLVDVETIIVTNNFLNDAEFRELLSRHEGPVLLIADEVHNLGGGEFLTSPPDYVEFRIGLSATPERQYDADGTADLFDFFGDVVFEFGLSQAIGVCLVPYDYFVHAVELTHDELGRYRELSEKIRKLQITAGRSPSVEDEERLQLLRNRRRLILEGADGKLTVLNDLLTAKPSSELKHLLVYATDKDPQQLESVNTVVRDLGFRFHQITADETGAPALVDSVLSAFQNGTIQVLTAKRVLDEGLNIPEISTAIILASTTVERQWVQRRGRVLRMCSAIGKEYATIHDFLVLPPSTEPIDSDMKRLVKGELARCDEFTELARNRASPRGPRDLLQEVRLEYIV